ncbi:MAG: hypothetical protein F4X53_13505 [Acidimicrobiales bacterium]|nr:hypothetical protein [Acidimicrobiales bacterium]
MIDPPQPMRAARSALACVVALTVLSAGCGLLPGGDDASPPAPAVTQAVATTETPAATTEPSQVELVDPAAVAPDDALEAEVFDAATQTPTTTTEVVLIEVEPPPVTVLDDPTECADRELGAWTVARLRDGACAGWVRGTGWEIGGPPADDTFLGLVCHWTGEEQTDAGTVQQGEVKVFTVLPTIAGSAEIDPVPSRFRWWVFPLERHASAWRRWALVPPPPPHVYHDDGLLRGPLAESLAARMASPQTTDPADALLEQSSGAELADEPTSASADASASDGVHPARVAFAPSAVTSDLVGDQDDEGDGDDPDGEVPVLRRYSDPEERRFGRPFEIWLEAVIWTEAEEDEEASAGAFLDPEGGGEDPEEQEPEIERWTFPLVGAADALRIVADDCAALNEGADPGAS